MPHPLAVSYEDIERLSPQQLAAQLLLLVRLEAMEHGIDPACVTGSLKINVSDGGEDCRIRWRGGPEAAGWIPRRYTMYQSKAGGLSPADCKKEILRRGTKKLKPLVEEALDADGAYVLFIGKAYTRPMIERRIERIRQGIAEAGKGYARTADVRVMDANQIAQWSSKHVSSLVEVRRSVGKYVPGNLQTWHEWARYPENSRFSFVPDDPSLSAIDAVRRLLTQARQTVRIVGLSGLGKTRLALEALRPPEDPDQDPVQAALAASVVYCDVRGGRSDLASAVASWRDEHLRCTLVVDNCEQTLHNQLRREVQHPDSQCSLLTLDFTAEPPHTEYPVIRIERSSHKVICGMLSQAYPGMPEVQVHRIAEFADGFPRMAVLLASAQLATARSAASLVDDELLKRLLWGRETLEEEDIRVLRACAMCERLGFEGNAAAERCFLASEVCGVTETRFYEVVSRFGQRGIIEQRGDYVRVVPLPLALRLAGLWLAGFPPERIAPLLVAAPPPLAAAMCDRLAKFDQHPKAQQAVAGLCRPMGLFSRAEVLNTEACSRMFRSLVEIAPVACVSALQSAFEGWDRERLLSVGPGRRDLIWALEKLCFRRETFHGAARLMLRFASAENEEWGNNATGQFCQLFQVLLSGTEAPPAERLTILDEAITAEELRTRKVGVAALGRALPADFYSRGGGSEDQGGGPPLRDWHPPPAQWPLVVDYWRGALERLTSIACRSDELGELAREQIAKSIFGLVEVGLISDLEQAVTAVVRARGRYWPEAMQNVRSACRAETREESERLRARLAPIIDLLTPQAFPQRLRLIVSLPAWDLVKDDETGGFVDLSQEEAVAFARECARDPSEILCHLPIILEGEQRKAYPFALELARQMADPAVLVEAVLDGLRRVPPERANSTAVGAVLVAVKHSNAVACHEALEKMVADPALAPHVVNVTRMLSPTEQDLRRVVRVVRTGAYQPSGLRMLGYGQALAHLPPGIVIDFCDAIAQRGNEEARVALEILRMYLHGDEEKQHACVQELRRIILIPGLMSEAGSLSDMDDYNWKETCLTLLAAEARDEALAQHVAREIAAICRKDAYPYSLDHSVRPVVRRLFAQYGRATWPIFGAAATSGGSSQAFHVAHLLGPDPAGSSEAVLLTLPEEILREWCQADTERAPSSAARMMPPLSEDGEGFSWHPLVRWLLDEFGDQDRVLSAISANLGTYICWGSAVPHFERQIHPLEELAGHPRPKVREWARARLESVRQSIAFKQKREQERQWGIL